MSHQFAGPFDSRAAQTAWMTYRQLAATRCQRTDNRAISRGNFALAVWIDLQGIGRASQTN
jgi:hypothetical protein